MLNFVGIPGSIIFSEVSIPSKFTRFGSELTFEYDWNDTDEISEMIVSEFIMKFVEDSIILTVIFLSFPE